MKELTYKQKELFKSLVYDRNCYKAWLISKEDINDQFVKEVKGCLAWAEEDLRVKEEYDKIGIYYLLNVIYFLKEQNFVFSNELKITVREANEFINKQEIKAYE